MPQIIDKPQTIHKLKEACNELFPENDSAYRFEVKGFDILENDESQTKNILKLAGLPADAKVEVISLKSFLYPYTGQVPEYGIDEKSRASRFLHLQGILEDTLDSIKVYIIGEHNNQVIILGKMENGVWAGLQSVN